MTTTTPAVTWTIADSASKNNEDGSKSLILTLRATKTLTSGAMLHTGQFVYELPNPSATDIASFVNKANIVLTIALAPVAAAAPGAAPAASNTTAASSTASAPAASS